MIQTYHTYIIKFKYQATICFDFVETLKKKFESISNNCKVQQKYVDDWAKWISFRWATNREMDKKMP